MERKTVTDSILQILSDVLLIRKASSSKSSTFIIHFWYCSISPKIWGPCEACFGKISSRSDC